MTGSAGGGLVASQHPVITNRKPTTVATVISSSRNNAPNATATTGLTNVIRPALAGPASADKEHGHIPSGGTGFAVATIVEHLVPRE